MPIWGIVLAVLFTVVLQIPIGMLLAVTNMEISTRILSHLVSGYVFEGQPIPNMIFQMFSFMSTHQSLNFASDLKLAHYAKIPPRWAFAAQVYATLLAGFVGLGVNRWLLRNVEDVCQAHQKDRFTCPRTHTFFMSSVIWGVVGPRRLFGTQGPYRAVTYTIPIGVIVPIAVYFMSKRWPNSFWRNVNAPILFHRTDGVGSVQLELHAGLDSSGVCVQQGDQEAVRGVVGEVRVRADEFYERGYWYFWRGDVFCGAASGDCAGLVGEQGSDGGCRSRGLCGRWTCCWLFGVEGT
ncbi:hypothetical protein FNYG_04496 [Fusarium nygamai]|uniref:Uncharacterized protein n=1 Tax=Gibberella nygamai TaxID=42673 RepID=A0A2K0WJ53_GIBNY|nr:hypothetical protein FNYG_04496 [Fusarium nygamai]